ncbi:proline iminopeptidase [Yersinia nurmii]|uniref:Proline iminopeptidase n=1 Tax=Yersinia nurmii TaxID=685706 RepID=A0ABM9SHJ9_9GAMM|nr:alpha/beta fold hydrolase [Yersinia nurmii]CNE60509.1 proline iminopeptidase [Yersinia nurmii]
MTQVRSSGFFPVDDLHSLYWERHGNPQGEPWIVIHGGPAGQSHLIHTAFFDLSLCDVLIFDQRGCGQSLPYGERRINTINHLVDDIERLRCFLKMPRANILGLSWGCWLGILYKIRYGMSGLKLVIGCPFIPIATVQELHWFYFHQQICQTHSLKPLLIAESESKSATYYRCLRMMTTGLASQKRAIAQLWVNTDEIATNAHQNFYQPITLTDEFFNPRTYSAIMLEIHYHAAGFFITNDILRQVARMDAQNVTLIGGEKDRMGMVATHWLAERVNVEVILVRDIAHQALHTEMITQLRHLIAR